jgi:hypothetical protein
MNRKFNGFRDEVATLSWEADPEQLEQLKKEIHEAYENEEITPSMYDHLMSFLD